MFPNYTRNILVLIQLLCQLMYFIILCRFTDGELEVITRLLPSEDNSCCCGPGTGAPVVGLMMEPPDPPEPPDIAVRIEPSFPTLPLPRCKAAAVSYANVAEPL